MFSPRALYRVRQVPLQSKSSQKLCTSTRGDQTRLSRTFFTTQSKFEEKLKSLPSWAQSEINLEDFKWVRFDSMEERMRTGFKGSSFSSKNLQFDLFWNEKEKQMKGVLM